MILYPPQWAGSPRAGVFKQGSQEGWGQLESRQNAVCMFTRVSFHRQGLSAASRRLKASGREDEEMRLCQDLCVCSDKYSDNALKQKCSKKETKERKNLLTS